MSSEKCPHLEVVESKTYLDGSIDGKCTSCGEDGFPIRDVPYEEFLKTEEGQYRCGFLNAMDLAEKNPEEYERILSQPLIQPWKEK